MGSGFFGQAAGFGRRLLLPGLSQRPALREQSFTGQGSATGGVAQDNRCDCGGGGRVGGSRFVPLDESTISSRSCNVFAEGPTRLDLFDERHRQARQGWFLPEDYPLRAPVPARR